MEESQSSAPRRVEAYLDTVLTSLPHHLSPSERDELRRELREHLWSRVEAYKELGQAEDDAVTEALQQFGGGKDFMKQWKHNWAKPPRWITPRDVWEATVPTLPLSAIAIILAFVPPVFAYYQYHFYGGNCWLNRNHLVFGYILWPFLLFVLPVIFGGAVAKYVPKNAVVGVFAALCLDAVLGQLVQLAGGTILPKAAFLSSTIFVVRLSIVWIPIACGSAALTGWWTRRTQTRQVA